MNRLLIFCCFVLSAALCWAQKIKQEQFFLANGLVDVQAGASMPIQDYGLSELTLPAGYAKPGYHFKLGINYDIVPFLGLAVQYQHIQNPYNTDKILGDLRNAYPNSQFNSYESKPWELRGLMLGLYYPLKTYKTTIDVRVLGALLTGVLPESEYDRTEPSLNNMRYHFLQRENSSSSFGVQAGVKIRYQLYKKIILSSSLDYTYTKIKFENIDIVETTRHLRYYLPDYTQKFQIINLSLGIGVQFN